MELVPLMPDPQPSHRGASTAPVPLATTGLRRAGGKLPSVCLLLSSSTLIGLGIRSAEDGPAACPQRRDGLSDAQDRAPHNRGQSRAHPASAGLGAGEKVAVVGAWEGERVRRPREVLQVREVPEPESEPGQVHLRMLASPIGTAFLSSLGLLFHSDEL